MFENLINFLKRLSKNENDKNKEGKSKDKAKERLQLVLTQDRANVSADFLELMKQEIIDVIKKYIEVEENAIDVRITNKVEEDGTTSSPSLYANIPILNIKKETNKEIKEKIEANKDRNEEEKENKDKIKDEQDNNETKKTDNVNEEDNKETEKEEKKKTKEVKDEEEKDKKTAQKKDN